MTDSTIIKIDEIPVLDRGRGVRTWPLVVLEFSFEMRSNG